MFAYVENFIILDNVRSRGMLFFFIFSRKNRLCNLLIMSELQGYLVQFLAIPGESVACEDELVVGLRTWLSRLI